MNHWGFHDVSPFLTQRGVRICSEAIACTRICLTCRQDSTASFCNNFVGFSTPHFNPYCSFFFRIFLYLPRILSLFLSDTYRVCRTGDCILIHNSIKCAVFNLCIHWDMKSSSLNFLPFLFVYWCLCVPGASVNLAIFFSTFYLLDAVPNIPNCLILKYVMETVYVCIVYAIFSHIWYGKSYRTSFLNPNGMFGVKQRKFS